MLRTPLPPNRYNTETYPKLDPDAIGKVIPIGYGTLTGLPAVEIDTDAHRYKIIGQPLAEITRLATESKDPLVKNVDYQEYLSSGEFRLTYNSKFVANDTYYFAVCGDWSIDGTHYLDFGQNTGDYANGFAYSINGSSVWSVKTTALRFKLYGRNSAGDPEQTLAENLTDDATAGAHLRMGAADTRIGQAFKPAFSLYPTRLTLTGIVDGTLPPAGTSHLWVIFYRAISPEDIYAALSAEVHVSDIDTGTLDLTFDIGDPSPELECDVKAPSPELTQVDDILSDVVTNVLGKSASLLDATALAALGAARTEALKVYIGDEITYEDFIGRLEAGQFWKHLPLQDGTYAPTIFAAGEPGNTPHFRDQDFVSFRMELDVSQLRRQVVIQYDENFEPSFFSEVQASSDVAKFFYSNWESMTIETYLALLADAQAVAAAYLARYEVPIIKAVFEVHGWALDLLAGRDKVKLTHTRAAYAGGTLSGVLFRIVRVVKKPESNVVEVTAAIWGNSAV